MVGRSKYKLPFKKKRKKEIVKDVAPEPVRMSLYDVTKNNYKVAGSKDGRAIYLHRCMYLGEHSFEKPENIEEALTQVVQDVDSEILLGDQHLSGVLLYYERFFCVLIEGSEDALNHHLQLLFERHENNIKRSKLIVMIHHIAARFLNGWICYYGKPAILVEDLDVENFNWETSMRYIKNCTKRLYDFANAFSKDSANNEEPPDDDGEDESCATLTTISESGIKQVKTSFEQERPVASAKKREKDKDLYRDLLPETKVFEFMISSRYLTDLIEMKNSYGVVRQVDNYSDLIWPIPPDFIPYDVFNKPRDPVHDFPTHRMKAEEDSNSQVLDPI